MEKRMKFFDAPIRPELSCSMAPEFCDFIEINMDTRQLQFRMSGMTSPVIMYDEGYEESFDSEGTACFLSFFLGPLFAEPQGEGAEIIRYFDQIENEGIRRFRYIFPRGTLTGSALDYIQEGSFCDPSWDEEMEPSTFEEYLRLTGMRRGRAEIEKEWARLEACRISGEHPNLEAYPALTAPGGGCFLS